MRHSRPYSAYTATFYFPLVTMLAYSTTVCVSALAAGGLALGCKLLTSIDSLINSKTRRCYANTTAASANFPNFSNRSRLLNRGQIQPPEIDAAHACCRFFVSRMPRQNEA